MNIRRVLLATVLAASTLATTAVPRPAQAATYTLTSCNTSELINAVLSANSTPADDTIILPGIYSCPQNYSYYARYTFTDDYNNTGTALPAIAARSIAGKLTIDGREDTYGDLYRESLYGNPNPLRFFELDPGAHLELRYLELVFGGGVEFGGAIKTNGTAAAPATLITNRVIFNGNSTSGSGGAVHVGAYDNAQFNHTSFTANLILNSGSGNAIYTAGNTEVYNSRFYNNRPQRYQYPTGGSGGAIGMSGGTLIVRETMISENSTVNDGGGIAIYGGTADIQRTTITQNWAGIGDGGGIYAAPGAVLRMTNTIVAQNNDGSSNAAEKYPDVRGTFDTSAFPYGRNNLIGVGYGASGISDGVLGNRIGTATAPLDPRLTRLTYGDYFKPLPSSPAINAGLNTAGLPQLDIRRVRRVLYNIIDIGAVEYKRPDSVGVVLPTTGAWLFRYTNTTGPADTSFLYGQGLAGYTPISGDWDGNGTDTQGLYARYPANNIGVFALSNQFNTFDAVNLPAFPYTDASESWIPVKGDWDGDGDDTIGAYNTTTGLWSLNNENESNAPEYAFYFGGGAGIVPVTGDWSAQGRDGIGTFNFNTGEWRFSDGIGSQVGLTNSYSFGAPGYYPVPGDWDGNGSDTIGLYKPSTGDWILLGVDYNQNNSAFMNFGADPNLKGISGKWLNVTAGGGASPIREGIEPQIAPTFAP